MIIEISVALIALAFIFLVLYLILLTKALRQTLNQVNQTLVETRKQLHDIGSQANDISADLKQKGAALNPIFNAVQQAGQILEHQSTVLKRNFVHSFQEEGDQEIDLELEERIEKKKRSSMSRFLTVGAVLELAGIGINLWQKLKKRR